MTTCHITKNWSYLQINSDSMSRLAQLCPSLLKLEKHTAQSYLSKLIQSDTMTQIRTPPSLTDRNTNDTAR